jgi:hypothetical protein
VECAQMCSCADVQITCLALRSQHHTGWHFALKFELRPQIDFAGVAFKASLKDYYLALKLEESVPAQQASSTRKTGQGSSTTCACSTCELGQRLPKRGFAATRQARQEGRATLTSCCSNRPVLSSGPLARTIQPLGCSLNCFPAWVEIRVSLRSALDTMLSFPYATTPLN